MQFHVLRQSQVTILLVHLLLEFQDLHVQYHVLEIIHLILAVVHVHNQGNDQVEDRAMEDQVMEDQECQVRDQDQFVQVLQRDHHRDQMAVNDQMMVNVLAEDLVERHHHNLLIAHKVHVQVAHQVPVVDNALEDLVQHVRDKVQDLVLAELLEKAAERKRITRVRKPVVKKSTICKRQPSEVQLFPAVMELRRFACVAALP